MICGMTIKFIEVSTLQFFFFLIQLLIQCSVFNMDCIKLFYRILSSFFQHHFWGSNLESNGTNRAAAGLIKLAEAITAYRFFQTEMSKSSYRVFVGPKDCIGYRIVLIIYYCN